MSQLDAWLFDNYQLSRADLLLNIEKITANASRYSKEHTLSRKKAGINRTGDIESALETYVEDWIDEYERSAEEDEQGAYRSGEDMQVANAIAESFAVLQKLGSEATLDKFPFESIPEEVQQFFCRALQKELGSSLRKMGKIDSFGDAMVYVDREFRGILEMEF